MKNSSVLRTLVFLTIAWLAFQISLLAIAAHSTNMLDQAIATLLTSTLLHSTVFLKGVAYFIASQLLLYAVFVGVLWYLTVEVGALLRLNQKRVYLFGITLFIISLIFICTANHFLVPHSFFSNYFIKNHLLLKMLFLISASLLGLILTLALLNLIYTVRRWHIHLRQGVALVFLSGIVFLSIDNYRTLSPRIVASTPAQPNVIIIGIDALRPDFIGFYTQKTLTPTIDAILKTGTNFANAYTALPRTFPSWTGILTGTYPKNNHARGNNVAFENLMLTQTMPKIFQQAGYETIYSTDDTRFNNTNQLFGFDRVVTPPMGINDFLIGTLNDFPLSNLIIPTVIGKYLFPYNYANHGPAITYAPQNYLQMLNAALQQRTAKPLFLAVHFTVTHWPFDWFNDRGFAGCSEVCRYQGGIRQADYQLAAFLKTLTASHLLDHAIVVLLSDHGVSLGLPGDRSVAANNYVGDKANLKKLSIFKYAGTPEYSLDFQHDFGIDTSHGYGGDVLSLKQYHAVLAFKGYGVDLGKAQTIAAPVMLIDIAPTLLSLAHLTPLTHTDGIDLSPYLQGATPALRPFFFESSFTLEEIEKEGISIQKVLAKTVDLYRIDPRGLVFMKNDAEVALEGNKQYAVMQNDWLLAYYPASYHQSLSFDAASQQMILKKNIIPGFPVLVNLKTGAWTMELTTAFAKQSPAKTLLSQLQDFYGINAIPISLPADA